MEAHVLPVREVDGVEGAQVPLLCESPRNPMHQLPVRHLDGLKARTLPVRDTSHRMEATSAISDAHVALVLSSCSRFASTAGTNALF